jgi:hypothetical protein
MEKHFLRHSSGHLTFHLLQPSKAFFLLLLAGDRIIQFIETTNSTRNKSMCVSIKSREKGHREGGKGTKKEQNWPHKGERETMRGEIKRTAGSEHTIWSRGRGGQRRYKNGYQSNIKVSTFNKLSFSVKSEKTQKENRPGSRKKRKSK